MRPRNVYKVAFGTVALAAGIYLGWRAWSYPVAPLDPSSAEHLAEVAAEINRQVPMMIDPETELLPVQSAEGLLVYNYRLVGYSAAQLDAAKFAAGARRRVVQGACTTPQTREDFLDKGVTLRYAYFDRDRRPIAAVDVKPSDCDP